MASGGRLRGTVGPAVVLALLASAAGVAAQGQRQTAVMAIGATVVRSCSVQVAESAVRVSCGRDLVTYPPASAGTSSAAGRVLPSVTVSDGSRVTIEF
jgi:hypothetical protein